MGGSLARKAVWICELSSVETSWSDFINGQDYVLCPLYNDETTVSFWDVRPVNECHMTTDFGSVESHNPLLLTSFPRNFTPHTNS